MSTMDDGYLISLLGHEETQSLVLLGANSADVAKRAVEERVEKFGVPEPWIGYRVERFESDTVCRAIEYTADECDNPNWRNPGVSAWKWGKSYDPSRETTELANSLRLIIGWLRAK